MQFKAPPINEVSIGFWFAQPILALRSEHLGLFWATIRNDFPLAQQAPPLLAAPDASSLFIDPTAANEIFPMPRYWFMQRPIGGYLIQIQRDAFFVNWRRGGAEYQLFEEVKREFDRRFAEFQAFVVTELDTTPPTPRLCDLNYTNLVEKGTLWTGWRDTPKIIQGFSTPQAQGECSFNQVAQFPIDSDTSMTVTVRNGMRADTREEVLAFELKAQGVVEGGAAADAWFSHAHAAVHATFLDVTTEEARQRCWQQL